MKNTKKKNQGFTLVEIIVVLVILAILAALMVPALTSYIDKAEEKTVVVEARNALVAAQTLASEKYAKKDNTAPTSADIIALAEIDTAGAAVTSLTITAGKVDSFTYENDTYTVSYTKANKFGDPAKK